MFKSKLKPGGRLRRLLRPSPNRSVLGLVIIGVIIGLTGTLAFDATLRATSTQEFCVGCHEMADNALVQMRKTSHFNNASGVHAGCSDCHVPQQFIAAMIHKAELARMVWGTVTGVIDTPDKYAAHAPHMKRREITRLKANNSRECRNCHDPRRMMLVIQSARAQQYHQVMLSDRKTCIDCHAGIAHPQNSANLSQ